MPHKCHAWMIPVLATAFSLLATSIVAAKSPFPAQVRARMVGPDGRALAHGVFRVEFNGEVDEFPIDGDGWAVVKLPPFNRHQYGFTLWALAPGYGAASQDCKFWATQPPATMPSDGMTFTLVPGAAISGTIRNGQGVPIAGAKVRLFIYTGDSLGDTPIGAVMHTLSRFAVLTDTQGRWRCDVAPAKWEKAYIQPSHPEYATEFGLIEQETSALLDGTASAVMQPGRSIAGTVVDGKGKPVAGAVVHCGDRLDDECSKITTGADGKFEFPHVSTNGVYLFGSAGGYAPVLKAAEAGNVTGMQLTLPSPRRINGRVVDENGTPVSDCGIYISELGEKNSTVYLTDGEVWSDADGRFVLNAPAEGDVKVSAFHEGFSASDHTVPPSTTELAIVMQQPAPSRLAGSVVDQETGLPIKDFTVLTATDDPGEGTWWQEPGSKGHDGHYEISCDSYVTYRARIEADGYLPAMSGTLKFTNKHAAFDVRLVKAAPLRGQVRSADGKPVGGARVVVITPTGGSPQVDAQLQVDGAYFKQGTTDEAGNFVVPAPGEEFKLLVLHDSGYMCESDKMFANSSDITLAPWSRIEGDVQDDGHGVDGATVFVHECFELGEATDAIAGRVGFDSYVKTDAKGHYVIAHVQPGSHAVVRIVDLPTQAGADDQCKTVVSGAVETAHVDFGLRGRTVTGRTRLPASMPSDWMYSFPALVHLNKPGFDPATESFSPGAGFTHGSDLAYGFRPAGDGTFTLPGVEPGDYRLVIRAVRQMPGAYCGTGEVVAECVQDVKVLAGETTPINLGECGLQSVTHVGLGDAMPGVTCVGLDGKAIAISDDRGKYLMVIFWATWCAPCMAEMPSLIKLHDNLAKEPGFAMLGISMDTDAEAVRRCVNQQHLAWRQGILPENFDSKAARSLGVTAIPAIWMIDPQGKVIAKDLRPEYAENFLRKKLAH